MSRTGEKREVRSERGEGGVDEGNGERLMKVLESTEIWRMAG